MKKATFEVSVNRHEPGTERMTVQGYTHEFKLHGWTRPITVGFHKHTNGSQVGKWNATELSTGMAIRTRFETRSDCFLWCKSKLELLGEKAFYRQVNNYPKIETLPKVAEREVTNV